MHDLVETGGEILRRRGYDGYLHLKILPGATRADIHDAARVADRISINLETTSPDRLGGGIAGGVKDYRQDILKRQSWVAEEKPGGHTTQFVVGGRGRDRCGDPLLPRRPVPAGPAVTGLLLGVPRPSGDSPPRAAPPRHPPGMADTAVVPGRLPAPGLRHHGRRTPGCSRRGGVLCRPRPESGSCRRERAGGRQPRPPAPRPPPRPPGIGPKAADRILSLRRVRPFTGPADLARAGIRGGRPPGAISYSAAGMPSRRNSSRNCRSFRKNWVI